MFLSQTIFAKANIDQEIENRFYKIIKITGKLGICIQLGILLLILSVKVHPSVITFQVFTCLYWLIIFYIIKLRHTSLYFLLIFFFTPAHMLVMIVVFGSEAGFQHYAWIGFPLILFDQLVPERHIFFYIISGFLIFLGIHISADYIAPASNYPQLTPYLNTINFSISFLIFAWICFDFRLAQISFQKVIGRLTKTDHLTELLNRRGILEELESDGLETNPQNISIVMFDIDHFKRINDQFGHNTGDDVLQKVALILKQSIGSKHMIARWGGEEFVLICIDSGRDQALAIAQMLKAEFAVAHIHHRNNENNKSVISFTATFGISEVAEKETILDAIERADIALFRGKKAGRDSIIIAR